MKKSILLGGVVFAFFAYFACFAGNIWAGDATLTLDDNAGSSSFVVQDSDKTNQFKVNSDGQGYFAGNVGIGTTSPGRKLHIHGSGAGGLNFKVSDAAAGSTAFEIDTSTSAHLVVGSNYAMSITPSGNVGIGTKNPERKLHVHSTSGPSELGIRLYLEAARGWDFKIKAGDPKLYIYDYNGDADRLVIDASGNVGIGTTSPSEKLEVSGNIKASGTVSQGSSKEFKKNIAYVSTKDAMKALNKLNPVRFEYKTDDSGEKHLGFIAEDVPDLVAEQDRKHLNSMDITAVLTKVVQEQQKMIASLSAKVKSLEERIGQN